MTSRKGIIVWVWEDDRLMWQPYDPHVSNFIEQKRYVSQTLLGLQPADTKMKHYCIDFQNMKQIRTGTGTLSFQCVTRN